MKPISSFALATNLLLAASLLSSCNGGGMSSYAQHGAAAMPVKVCTVGAQLVNQSTSFMGMLKSRRSAVLQPRVSGTISKIFVAAGQTVAEGTPLLEIDSEKQRATFSSAAAAAESIANDRRSAEETLHSLQSQLGAKEANVKFMQQELRRYGYLSQQGAVARETYDNYATQLKVAQSDLSALQDQIQAQKATIAKFERQMEQNAATRHQEQVQLQYYTLRAPFAGTVGDIPLRIGEYVDSTTKVTTVTQNQPLEVYISVPAEKASALRKSMPVVLVDSARHPLGEATVFFISPVADDSQSVLVKALYPNADGSLRSNQTVTAQIVWQRTDSITIPTYAVSHISGQDFVFVAEGSAPNTVAKQKPVTLGEIVGNDYVVKQGLQPGQKLVVSGVQNLIDNTPISAEERHI